jgi:hypothetical protein
LTPLRHFLKRGTLRFEKFGHIDECSNIPQGHAIFLDCDSIGTISPPPPKRSYIRWILSSICGIQIQSIYYKKTQRGWHVIIRVHERLTPLETVALQSILGSDPMREALDFMRAREIENADEYWQTRWNILYDFKVTK